MKSAIIYNGPSLLDGEPIVVIATYSNRNKKTGTVVQTYILCRDINPLEASKTGADSTICGDCVMRGTPTTDPVRKIAKNRKCYVNLGQGVLIVWKAFQRGVYKNGIRARHGPRTFCPRWDLRGPRSLPRVSVGGSTSRSGHFHSIFTSKRLASRYRDAKRGHSRTSGSALVRGAAHIPSYNRTRGSRQNKRDTLSGIKRGRTARPMHSVQIMQGI